MLSYARLCEQALLRQRFGCILPLRVRGLRMTVTTLSKAKYIPDAFLSFTEVLGVMLLSFVNMIFALDFWLVF